MIKEIILLLSGIILVALTLFAYIYKLFSTVNVHEIEIPGGVILYKVYQGSYYKISSSLDKIISKSKEIFKKDQSNIKFFGVYYDNPNNLKDINKCRAIIGILYNQNNENKIQFNAEEFIKENKDYHYKALPSFKSIGCIFPLFNYFTMLINIIRGYPAIMKYAEEKKIKDLQAFSMEMYDYIGRKFTILFPCGESSRILEGLSGFLCPEYKIESKIKNE